ncbi:MAG TPA: helix-turn-helix domain-containing protein [Xanthobacteraceae bacterium]|jgi:predicted DNA-binding transcriptional regulator AlpA|nr:helix-turn-helix domain-containing protein [Xanthobacteraceae bacterium]
MSEIDDEDAILDARAAARFLGLAVATLAKMRCMGGGPPFVKAGRRVLYRRSDLVEWLNARRVRNTAEAQSVPRRLTDSCPANACK